MKIVMFVGSEKNRLMKPKQIVLKELINITDANSPEKDCLM